MYCGTGPTIKRGQKIALIGESGSGKTTFLKLIHGMYANSSASLAFDGVDSNESLQGINLNTMLVPQDPELFSSSIEENLTLGIEYSPVEIQAAVDTARFAGVVATLPRGLALVRKRARYLVAVAKFKHVVYQPFRRDRTFSFQALIFPHFSLHRSAFNFSSGIGSFDAG